ncbi:MAG: 4Fe-4S binding protein [Butyrivibrio sp.]|nr:4Fe-4S binding protein [Butyrivibrio sp.]
MASKRFARVDRSICVSCGACANVCPKEAIAVWKGCYAEVNTNLCIGCGLCERTCPAVCISMREREGAA